MSSKQNELTGTEPSTPSGKPAGRRWKRRLFAIALGLLPFVALEVGLRAIGVGGQPEDLHAGFGDAAALFTLDEDTGQFRTSLTREQFFVAQSFPEEKPDDEFRIFCLGGSTVQGRPYRPETSFGKWLELELSATDTSRRFRTINCGGISYASYRLRPVLQEVLDYQPDLIVLATGHNEFLEDQTYAELKSRSGARILLENAAKYSRTVMLLRNLTGGAPRVEPKDDTAGAEGVKARLDNEAGYASYHRDEEWHAHVCTQFRESVQQMLQMCQQADVPVLLVRLGANMRDCPPFKSEHRSDLTVEDEQTWQELFDQATAAAEADAEQALALYRKALEIDDQYPLLHFRIGRSLDQLGRFSEAKQSYQNALDADICPLRMVSRISNDLIDMAQKHKVTLVDAASLVAQHSPDEIPGYESYIDHVHPTIEIHQLIAAALAAQLRADGVVTGGDLSAPARRKIFSSHVDSLGPAYFANGLRRIGWLEGWARRQRLYDETIPVDARGYLAAAIRHLDLHDYDSAAVDLQMAVQFSSPAARYILNHAAALFGQGRTSEARWVVDELVRNGSAPELQKDLTLAQLILAVDSRNMDAIGKLRDAVGSDAELPDPSSSSWRRQMPDVLKQADRLLTD